MTFAKWFRRETDRGGNAIFYAIAFLHGDAFSSYIPSALFAQHLGNTAGGLRRTGPALLLAETAP